jgi:hypothetical protein
MNKSRCSASGYNLSAVLGTAHGGLAIVTITRAISEMVSRLTSNMMRNLMKQMGTEGCNPEELLRRMLSGFGEAQ